MFECKPSLHASTAAVRSLDYDRGCGVATHDRITHRERDLGWRRIRKELRHDQTDPADAFLEVGVLFRIAAPKPSAYDRNGTPASGQGTTESCSIDACR